MRSKKIKSLLNYKVMTRPQKNSVGNLFYWKTICASFSRPYFSTYFKSINQQIKLTCCAYNRHRKFPSQFWSSSKFSQFFMNAILSSTSDLKTETSKMDLGISGVCYMHTMLSGFILSFTIFKSMSYTQNTRENSNIMAIVFQITIFQDFNLPSFE